jgi:hypothetical protein
VSGGFSGSAPRAQVVSGRIFGHLGHVLQRFTGIGVVGELRIILRQRQLVAQECVDVIADTLAGRPFDNRVYCARDKPADSANMDTESWQRTRRVSGETRARGEWLSIALRLSIKENANGILSWQALEWKVTAAHQSESILHAKTI